MREYLERIFPVLAKNETGVEAVEKRTWHLYDMINFVEFCVFIILRTALDTFFNICFNLVKFGIILAIAYGFAFCIFYYFDQYMPIEQKPTSVPRLKRPSEFEPRQLSNTSNRSYPHVIDYDAKVEPKNSKDDAPLNATESDFGDEQVVRVGSFRRSNADSGRQSIISKALDDLNNVETKTYVKNDSPRQSGETSAKLSNTSKGSNEKKIENSPSIIDQVIEPKSSVV